MSENIKTLFKEWKHRLQLDDWTIELRDNCSPEDMILDNVCGECQFDGVNKTAVIRLLDAKYYGDRIVPYNKEQTLIHELLHCKLWMLYDVGQDDLQGKIVHQLINDLAKALMETKNAWRKYEKEIKDGATQPYDKSGREDIQNRLPSETCPCAGGRPYSVHQEQREEVHFTETCGRNVRVAKRDT